MTNVIVQANPVVTYSINLMTDPPHCVQQGVQTVFQPDKPDQKTIMKHSLKFSQPAKSVHKTAKNAKEKDKRITTVKIRESNLGRELK